MKEVVTFLHLPLLPQIVALLGLPPTSCVLLRPHVPGSQVPSPHPCPPHHRPY